MTPYDDFPPRRRPPQPAALRVVVLLLLTVVLAAGGVYVYRHWLAPEKTGIDPSAEMRDVTPRAREKIVNTCDVSAICEQPFTKMRAEKASSPGN